VIAEAFASWTLARSVLVGAAPPPPISGDDARRAAQLEVSKTAYHQGEPSIAQRVIRWVLHRIGDALNAAARHSPGKGVGLFFIVVLLALIVIAVAIQVGRVRRTPSAARGDLFGGARQDAADHRALARDFAARSRYAEAVREWLRATTRELEKRGVLDPRPGRTAAELCAEASVALPGIADDLRRASSIFEQVWYGGVTATADDERTLRRLDELVAGSHRALAARR
jgi:uncharacterized protein DUF4129